MDLGTSSTTTTRPSGCFGTTLSSCKRFQIALFIFICTVYFSFVFNLFVYTFISSQDKSDNVEEQTVFNESTNNVKDVPGKNINISSDDEVLNKSIKLVHCKGSICLNKCCPVGKGFVQIQNRTCVSDGVNDTYYQEVFAEKAIRILKQDISKTDHLRRTFSFIDTCESSSLKEFELDKVRLMDDGNIELEGNIFRLSCLDFLIDSENIFAYGCKEDRDEYEDEDDEEENHPKKPLSAELEIFIFYIYVILMTISKSSIITILIVYSCIPQLRNIHGKLLICYLASIIAFQITFVGGMAHYVILKSKSLVLEFLTDTTLISWMTWLTLMCYDIWATFSRPLDAHPHLRNDSSKFRLYSIGGWGNVILHIILQVIVTMKNSKVWIMPLFIKVGVTLNVVMFVSTLHSFRFHKVHTPVSGRHGDSPKEGLLMYTKLMLLMGLDWLLILSGINFGGVYGKFLSLIVLETQGITLLLLLICNRRVLRLICRKCSKRQSV